MKKYKFLVYKLRIYLQSYLVETSRDKMRVAGEEDRIGTVRIIWGMEKQRRWLTTVITRKPYPCSERETMQQDEEVSRDQHSTYRDNNKRGSMAIA